MKKAEENSSRQPAPRPNRPIREENGLSICSPPWTLKGEAWWIILSIVGSCTRGRGRRTGQNSKTRSKFPALEDLENFEKRPAEAIEPNDFRGGFGSVQLVRYDASPVGAYDELLIIPGSYMAPEGFSNQLPAYRITRIYVSTLSSVLNGRHHWNIPKHLARFEFVELKDSPNKLLVKVFGLKSFQFTPANSKQRATFEPQFADDPFFSVIIRRHLAGVNLPVNLSKVPFLDLTLIQPPLAPAEPSEPNNAELNRGLIGTTAWRKTKLEIKGRCGLCSFEGNLAGTKGQFGDGNLFPDIRPHRFGLHFPQIHLTVPPSSLSGSRRCDSNQTFT